MRRALLAALVAALVGGCSASSESPGPPRPSAAETPPPFAACPEQPGLAVSAGSGLPPLAFECLGGGTLDLARAPGTPAVVNLWGSWCGPCREELPLLQEFADAAGDRVRVLGVISKDGVPQASSFGVDAGVTFPSAFDGEGALMAELGLNALPYTAFLAADGTLVAEHLGVQL